MILRTSGIGVSIVFLREAQWGSRGREFDSRHSDHKSNDFMLEIVGFFSFVGWPHLVLTTMRGGTVAIFKNSTIKNDIFTRTNLTIIREKIEF